MRRMVSLFQKDVLLGIKDVFVLMEIGFAVLIAIILSLFVPETIENEDTVYIYDQTSLVENFVAEFAADEADEHGELYVDSREAVIDGMVENRSAIGLVIEEAGNGRYAVEVLKQPYTTDKIVEFIETDMEDLLSILAPGGGVYPADVYEAVEIRALQEGRRDELPFNQRLLPPVLLMIVGLVGTFSMVSLVAQERNDKTIRAFRVSPTGLAAFITSKHLMLLALGFTTFTILYLSTMGFGGYLPALAVMVATILLGSALGVILGTFFENPMSSMGFLFLLMVVLGLPAVSLFNPVFSPGWLQIIPSYHTLFGLDAAMFPNDNSHIVWRSVVILAVIDVVLLPLSSWIFMSRTAKEV